MMFVIGVIAYIAGELVFRLYSAIGLALMLAGVLVALAACLVIALEGKP